MKRLRIALGLLAMVALTGLASPVWGLKPAMDCDEYARYCQSIGSYTGAYCDELAGIYYCI